ncbi:GspMb/PilO family protein [Telluria beijingensis]|uniref:GspMb/PilO family protein n=1 Tax=Telluria beijingensis TaxID=3068633 RepID=UPI002795489E|nr:GspMb/PilO family protein [Massilia sp. REN29]
MKPGIRDALAALPARQLNLMAIGVVLIALALAWSVGLRAPLAAHAQQRKALAALEARAAAAGVDAPQAAASAPASAASSAPPVAPAPLALIAAVSRSAAHAGVTVSSAAQGARQQFAGLRLHTLDISASGSYPAIVAWLADIETSQPTVGIIQFTLAPDDAGDKRRILLQLAIYDTEEKP